MKTINVGMIGFGTVGSGTAKLLLEEKDLITQKLGLSLKLKKIADLDIERPRPVRVDRSLLTVDPAEILNDPEIEIVIQLIGGDDSARTLMLEAISKGKHIVTANKALLASCGHEIFKKAEEYGVEVMFEASVGGGIPIIRALKEGLAANRINHFFGILNGTANYILTKMSAEGLDFGQALKEAREQGFAEADPTFDVEGVDTAHKLAILTSLAYGLEVELSRIHVEGISRLDPMDIQFASEFGYTIKLLAISAQDEGQVEARVHPAMLPADHVLAGVSGPFNAVLFNGSASGDILLYGQGAGMMPSASAVVSDAIELARAIDRSAIRRVPPLAWQQMGKSNLSLKPMDEIVTKYYFRFSVVDRPGVLSKISGVLGEHDISIVAVIQKGREADSVVPIVMLTHDAAEAAVKSALNEIDHLDIVKDDTVLVRVEDRL